MSNLFRSLQLSWPRSLEQTPLPTLSTRSASVVLGLVVVLVLGLAVQLHTHYAANEATRWSSVSHDRNAHYLYALTMATELRNGNLLAAIGAFDGGSMVWGPFHGVVLAALLTALGPGTTWAVLPSLAGFVLAAVFAFRIVRQTVSGPMGVAGGIIAALLVVASPAVRGYATDVMLESLGLGLTMLGLWIAARSLDDPTRPNARWLAATLSALFFLKYNYWLLVLFALGAGVLFTKWSLVFPLVWRRIPDSLTGAWCRRQLLSPVNALIVGLLILAAWTSLTGGWSIEIGGQTLSMKTTRVVVNVAYGLFLLRLWQGWRAGAADWIGEQVGTPTLTLIRGHLVPVLLWLALPLRLRYFLWYLSSSNTEGVYHASFTETVTFYWDGFVKDYCAAEWLALVGVGLAGLAILLMFARCRQSGVLVVPLFVLIAITLTLNHPNHKFRFLHSWAPVLFVLAGIAVAFLLHAIESCSRGFNVLAAMLAVGATGWFTVPLALQPGRANERGQEGAQCSVRELTEAYLPELATAYKTLIVSNTVARPWAKWSYYEQFGRTRGIENDFREIGWFQTVTPEVFQHWVQHTTCDTVVFVSVPTDSPLYEPPPPAEAVPQAGVWLRQQSRFRLDRTLSIPNRGTIEIWRRS